MNRFGSLFAKSEGIGRMFFDIDEKIIKLSAMAEKNSRQAFERISEITRYNQQKVLSAFIRNGVSETHFAASTGYGYGDRGRELIEKIFAECMGAEDSIYRHSFNSGTHAITVALFGVLRPGDEMLCVTGRPYDTLIGVLGIDGDVDGSLKQFRIGYNEVQLDADGQPDLPEISERIKQKFYRVVYIQRSRGYSLRPSLSVEKIGEIANLVKKISPETIVMVDNCYGEFVEKREPCEVGADIIVGSLIKNAGGGIARTGGYIAGKRKYIESCANRLTAPGIGKEIGASLGLNRELFLGLFNAPHVTGEALKTAIFTAALFSLLGYGVSPAYNEPRYDIIQTVLLKNEQALVCFCQGMQSGSPIDSFAEPEPWDMPGYDCKVIMAAGAFTLGASIELSADAPLREPYAVWMQGGLNFDSAQVGILLAVQRMHKDKIIEL